LNISPCKRILTRVRNLLLKIVHNTVQGGSDSMSSKAGFMGVFDCEK